MVTAIGVGDEGGFAPPISHPIEALDILTTAVTKAGHEGRVKFGIDAASSEFFQVDGYNIGFKSDNPNVLSPEQLQEFYGSLLKKYPIILLEDPFAEDDFTSWSSFHKQHSVELVGDDLLATNVKRMEVAKESNLCNSLLLKINQIGTISEALEAYVQFLRLLLIHLANGFLSTRKAFKYGWRVFVSHRSGETTDDFIADLTVGIGAGHLKSGSPCRGERVVKYNRLMDIEDELISAGLKQTYAGATF
jgi:enolase